MAFTTVKEVDSRIERFIETDPLALEDETISNNTGMPFRLCFVTEVQRGNKIIIIQNEALGTIECRPGEDVTITAAQQQEALDQGNHSDIYIINQNVMVEGTTNRLNKVRAGTTIPKKKTKK